MCAKYAAYARGNLARLTYLLGNVLPSQEVMIGIKIGSSGEIASSTSSFST